METKQKGKIWSLFVKVAAMSLLLGGLQPIFAFAQAGAAVAAQFQNAAYEHLSADAFSAPVDKADGLPQLQKTFAQNERNNFVQVTFKLNQEFNFGQLNLAVQSLKIVQNNLDVREVRVANLQQIPRANVLTDYAFTPAAPGEQPFIFSSKVEVAVGAQAVQMTYEVLLLAGLFALATQVRGLNANNFEVLRC